MERRRGVALVLLGSGPWRVEELEGLMREMTPLSCGRGSTSFGACEVRCWRWLFGNKKTVSLAEAGEEDQVVLAAGGVLDLASSPGLVAEGSGEERYVCSSVTIGETPRPLWSF